MRTRLKRGALGALVALLVLGAGAFASDNTGGTGSTATVSATTLSGTRTLTLSGASLTGPALLSVNRNATEAPFGVVVTDLAHERQGYDVTATLSDLYLLDPATSTFDCTQLIESSSFAVGFDGLPATLPSTLEGVAAVVDPTLTYAGDVRSNSVMDSVLTLGTITLSSTAVTVDGLLGATTEFASNLTFMDTADGTNPTAAFSNEDAHAGCVDGKAGDGADTRFLQTGTVATPTAASLLSEFEAFVDQGTDGVLSVADTLAAGVLESGADSPGGRLYDATRTEVAEVLSGVDLSTLGVTLDQVTADVVADMVATTVLDLVGQTGAYVNVPKLVYSPPGTSPKTGLYQGTMTVTLTDKP